MSISHDNILTSDINILVMLEIDLGNKLKSEDVGKRITKLEMVGPKAASEWSRLFIEQFFSLMV